NGERTTLSDVGQAPTDMVTDPELHRAFVSMAGTNTVAVIDYMTKQVLARIPVGSRPVHTAMAPVLPAASGSTGTAGAYSVADHAVALSHEIWVANDSGDSVSVIDGQAMRVKATIAVDKGHHKLAFSGSKAYVSNI